MIVYEHDGGLETGTVHRRETDAHGRTVYVMGNGDRIVPQQVVGRVRRGRRNLTEVYAAVNEVNYGSAAWLQDGSFITHK